MEIIYELLHGLTPKLRERILKQTLMVRGTLNTNLDMSDEDIVMLVLCIGLSNAAMLGVEWGDMIRLVARSYDLPPLYVTTVEAHEARQHARDEGETPPHTDNSGNVLH